VGVSYPVSVSQPNGAWLSSVQVGVTAVHGTASPYAHTPPMRLAGFLSEAPTSGEAQTRGTQRPGLLPLPLPGKESPGGWWRHGASG
jgi:hypothetical protein